MSSSIILKAEDLQATFLPENGMRCVSFKKGGRKIIEEGLLIGPHFNARHISGPKDPYSFGVGRYGKWKSVADEASFRASLDGEMKIQGEKLKHLQNQNFKMSIEGRITHSDLTLLLSIVSESDSLIGIQYLFPKGKESITTFAKNKIYREGRLEEIPGGWNFNQSGKLELSLSEAYDFAFRPSPDPTHGEVVLDESVRVQYLCNSEESSWMIKNDPNEDHIVLSAVTSQNPWKPNLTVSQIRVKFLVGS